MNEIPCSTQYFEANKLLLDAALLEDAQLKKALRKSMQDTHKLQASGSSEGSDFESNVLDESKSKPSDTNSEDESDNINDNDNDDDNANDDDKEDDDLYKDVDVRSLGAEHEKERKGDEEMTDVDQNKTESSKQSSSVSSDFTNKFHILYNVPPVVDEVASMMNVKNRQVESSTQAPSLFNVPKTAIPETSTAHTITVHPIISMITPLPQLTTASLAATTVPTTTSIPTLPNFSSLFRFDQRVSTLEKEMSQFKQAGLSAQLLKSLKYQIPTIVDDLLSTRIGYIDVVEKSIKDIIKDEVKSQLPQILPKEVSDFATPMIQSTINESLENAILAKSSSQPKSTYEAAASLIEFELKKILLDKIEKSKSY
ncbi:hypothetical protein Tco_0852719 [Tanacetum coccineum]